jgi:hypothetical protein
MQYKLPQFIEREATVVGPLSFRQFLYLGLAACLAFALYPFLYKSNSQLYFILSGGGFLLAGAMAFAKIEGRSFGVVVVSMFNFFLHPRTYIWKRKNVPMKFNLPKREIKEVEEKEKTTVPNRRRRLDTLADEIEIQ